VRTQGGLPAKTLKQTFKENLFKGIFEQTKSQQADSSVDINAPLDHKLIEKLDNYAIERWESVLKYIVNPKDSKNQVCNSTKDVLKFAGLMKSLNERADESMQSDDDESVTLTASAFQFLLWNRRLQIWYFIIQLLEYFWQVCQLYF
jgi:transcription initiation factor TFIIH subunit 4